MRTKSLIVTGHGSFCFPPLQQQFKIQYESTKLIFFHEYNAYHMFLWFFCNGFFQSHILYDSEITFKAQLARNHQFMPIRASCRAVVQALGFKCIICDCEFESKHAADCHRRKPAFIGTKCADPSSIWSLSLTERLDVSVGILRHHSAALYLKAKPVE